MKGSITQRGEDKWLVRVYVGRRDKKGNPIQVSRIVRGGKRKAETELSNLVSKVSAERLELSGVGATVGSLLDRWLEHIAGEKTPYTLQGYRRKINGRLRPAFGKTKLDKLRPEQMDRQYRAWLDEGLAPATVRQLHAILSAALQQAFRWGWIRENPARRVKPPTVKRKPGSVPSPDELRALIGEAERLEDDVLATAIALAAVTGCRRGELCALRWSDIDMETATVTVAESLTAIGRKTSAGDTKTHRGRRLALGDFGKAVVEQRKLSQEKRAREVEVPLDLDPYLLSRSARGDLPCLPDGLTHAFGRVARKLGMGYHFHQLRHWAATMAIASGHDPRTVAGRMGHAQTSTTLDIYSHVIEARDQDLAGTLGALLLPKSVTTGEEVLQG